MLNDVDVHLMILFFKGSGSKAQRSDPGVEDHNISRH